MRAHQPEAPLRTLMGPGPLSIHPRVYQALTSPVIGHMDPAYLKVLDRIGELLRMVFRTSNRVTNASPGSGTSGMEACVANLIEPGDPVLVCVNGYFGDRIRQMVERQEAKVGLIEGEWGKPIDPDLVKKAFKNTRYKVIALVHAETSTGVLQPMEEIARLAKEHGAMILLDTVTSLGGVDVKIDEWGVDAAYGCSQKCIGCTAGLSPVTFSDRAIEALTRRKHPVRSWYLDISLLDKYWGPGRVYHHTSSSTLNYGLLEALQIIEEEGLEARIQRHTRNHKSLVAGVEAMGLEMLVAPAHRLPSLNTVKIPQGVDDVKVRSYLLDVFNLEIGGGLGTLKGKVWRVGLMGYSSSAENIIFFLSAMGQALAAQGHKTDVSAGLSAAMSALKQ
ncbi:MAG: serine-pyruvate aminotransferase/archaeal aspartate aminotransferase [Deltaproteobacteria bacterium]|nr:serine-pyruvate aminotransferase/archaeal aspartate aminotransferase [Deltaproteobacteria bacterium]